MTDQMNHGVTDFLSSQGKQVKWDLHDFLLFCTANEMELCPGPSVLVKYESIMVIQRQEDSNR